MSEETERKGLPIVEFADQAALREWLSAHHDDATGVWLKLAKKGAPRATVTYAEAVEEGLCFGWIDGQVGRFDAHFYVQRFTPRTARSRWSQINVGKAEALIAAGRMHPAGRAQIDAARADGRWEAAYAAQSQATVPPDLQAALDQNPDAQAFFATLTGAKRYAFLHRLANVKLEATRVRRIATTIQMLREGRTYHD